MAEFFSWWYGAGWRGIARSLSVRLRGIAASFSVNQLIQTLFAPWRRIISYGGRSLDERLRVWADNTFSRIIGFVIRSIVLGTALLTMLVVGLLTFVELVLWPLVPLAVPVCLVAGAVLWLS